MRVRCVDGPYIGQTFEFPHPELHWSEWEHLTDPPYVGRRYPVSEDELPMAPLMWIINGVDRHAYSLVRHGRRFSGRWHLLYRDTF